MINKKGVTPIISIVLLLMITVAVAGTVSFWLGSVQEGAQSEIEDSTDIITSQTQQSVTVQFVTCDTVLNEVTVVIRNSGTRPIEPGEVSLTVSDEDGITNKGYVSMVAPWVARLDVDESETIVFDLDSGTPVFIMLSDDNYQLSVTVPGGASAGKVCTAQP
jgi:flagellin-like protein